jgi:hypothetical protein
MIGGKGGPDLAGWGARGHGGTGVRPGPALGKELDAPYYLGLGGGNASQGRQHDKQGCLGWASLFFLPGPADLAVSLAARFAGRKAGRKQGALLAALLIDGSG